MKTMQTETHSATKQRGYRFWLIRLALLLALPLLLYYSYCWGLWGRSSLLLQYLFQCNCPPVSEEARYPDTVDVIVSACKYYSSILSPSGRLLYVQEEESGISSTYLLDLLTNEKTSLFIPEGSNHFLTDDLLYLSLYYGRGYEGGEFIMDGTTGKQYPIQSFLHLQPEAYSYGELDSSLLFKALLQVEKVFLIDAPYQPVIALSSDFRAHPEQNFTFDASALPEDNTNLLEQFLQQNNIIYYRVPASFPHEAVSPDGILIARADGIYLLETDQKIVEGYSAGGLFHPYSGKIFSVRGWTHDNSGVIYSKFLNPCLIEASFFLSDEPGCFFAVPQPLLKLKAPEEYLLPAPSP